MTNSREIIVDSFAGGGGASLGIAMALGRHPDVAINHDADAIAMHAANHPDTHHCTEDVFKVNPRKVTKGRPVGLLWASPDCRNVYGIRRRGLLTAKSRCAAPSVWLCAPAHVGRAIGHAMRRHGLKLEQVAVVEVEVPRGWLKAGGTKGVKHTGGRDVPPDRVVSVAVLNRSF